MATQTAPPPVDRYMDLVREFPLRPIQNDDQHVRAIAILDQLSDLGERTPDEHDYFIVLCLIVEDHENSIYEHPEVPGPEMLRYSMEQAGLTRAQLSEQTGISVQTISDIVNGKRGISPKVRKTLAERFRMPPSSFL